MDKPDTVDAYIAGFPAGTRELLQGIRAAIRQAAPQAEECISYGMPTFRLRGNLVHFAGYNRHVGFYPAPAAITAFAPELSRYKQGKGSIQFPLEAPLPLDLITRMVQYRVRQQLEKPLRKTVKRS